MTGTVEALSIRTIRLRAVDGSVHLIPFSAVTTVTNQTRDYSYAVLDVSIGLNEEPAPIENVLREVAAEMQADPAWQSMRARQARRDGGGQVDRCGMDHAGPDQDAAEQPLGGDARVEPADQDAVRRERDREPVHQPPGPDAATRRCRRSQRNRRKRHEQQHPTGPGRPARTAASCSPRRPTCAPRSATACAIGPASPRAGTISGWTPTWPMAAATANAATPRSAPRPDGITRKPNQPHYQSRDFNALNGGIARWFEPMLDATGRHGRVPGHPRLLQRRCSPA